MPLSRPGFGRIVFADLRVRVEVDAWAWHRDREALRLDAARQNALTAARGTVIRTHRYGPMEEPETFLAALRAVLADKIRSR